jgi:hypothetical protein
MRSLLIALGKGTHKLLAILLAVSFALVLSLSLLLQASLTTLKSVESYDTVIDQARVVDRSQGLIMRYLISPVIQEERDQEYAYLKLMREIPLETWEKIARSILPSDWLRENLDLIIRSILAWVEVESASFPEITLELSPLIQELRSPKGSMAILPIIQQIPPCPPDENPSATVGQNEIPPCISENSNIIVMAEYTAQMVAISLPEQISTSSLQSMGLIDPGILSGVQKLHAGMIAAQATRILGLRTALLLLALYALMYTSSPASLLRSLALPMYLAGFMLALFLVGGYVFIQVGWVSQLVTLFAGLDIHFQAVLADVIRYSGYLIIQKPIAWSVLLVMLGLSINLSLNSADKWRKWRAANSTQSVKQPVRIRKQFR